MWKLVENLVRAESIRKQIKHIHHTDAHTTHTRASATFSMFDCNALQKIIHHSQGCPKNTFFQTFFSNSFPQGTMPND